jgi:predicted ribosomally synthesized peptide with nif11-like leader
VSLPNLDAFLAHARRTPALREQLKQPLELPQLLALAAAEGFAVEEADVLAAQLREESSLSAQELQERAGADARKLRSFIHS